MSDVSGASATPVGLFALVTAGLERSIGLFWASFFLVLELELLLLELELEDEEDDDDDEER